MTSQRFWHQVKRTQVFSPNEEPCSKVQSIYNPEYACKGLPFGKRRERDVQTKLSIANKFVEVFDLPVWDKF